MPYVLVFIVKYCMCVYMYVVFLLKPQLFWWGLLGNTVILHVCAVLIFVWLYRFGYAEFATPKEAKKALSLLSGMELDGRELRVDVANSRGGSGGGGQGGGFGRGTPRGRGR